MPFVRDRHRQEHQQARHHAPVTLTAKDNTTTSAVSQNIARP